MKAATWLPCGFGHVPIISIHAAREGGDLERKRICTHVFISIHAAREGGDVVQQGKGFEPKFISIHAAREGGDLIAAFAAASA